ncbi:hypothetical protein PARPLA_00475 [Rhodobacteraceae bacterium THAF1]|uniref:YqgE/AlgH family protein n=1 Tax=Palleronia sp. THAF1 TaxID=2587842 RepID=UPI000F3AF336|nr:YqgE/AlgH family protein [Palleronia sp. THAF1]QFU09962.1 hypothetical protein FIU81_14885 [Palleronia sp. THAF1]VDC17133.1 hypothetical protein PARPLA_00475 [Rhodobacteraceae bacterium THAF1]
MDKPFDLTAKLLIAMPGMGDPRFERSVVVMCAHGADGGMGLIVNKPAPHIDLGDLLEQLSIPCAQPVTDPVFFGGPVETTRGFVLHSPDYALDESTLDVGGMFAMTATLDILRAIGDGEGPGRALVALGYAGWGPGQVEDEIAQNGWLVSDASLEIVFAADHEDRWLAAIQAMGIDPILLSSDGGTA